MKTAGLLAITAAGGFLFHLGVFNFDEAAPLRAPGPALTVNEVGERVASTFEGLPFPDIGLDFIKGLSGPKTERVLLTRTPVVVRLSPGPAHPRLMALTVGQKIAAVGDSSNGWVPVRTSRGRYGWAPVEAF